MSMYAVPLPTILSMCLTMFWSQANVLAIEEPNWDDLARWQNVEVANADFVRYINAHKLSVTITNGCGVVRPSDGSYLMNVRKDRIVRVVVRVRETRSRHAFAGSLLANIVRSDGPEDVIRKLGSPKHDFSRDDGSRYLVYSPGDLVFDFDKDVRMAEVRLGSLESLAKKPDATPDKP